MATNPKLKLLVEKKSKKVVFAEAGKGFVDFLVGLLELPIGSILSILVDHGMSGSGSLDSLYQSVRDLDSNYLQPNQTKNSILTPKKADSNTKHSPLLKQLAYPKQESYSIYSTASRASTASSEVDGYVQGVVTYMVKDDLSVTPMSIDTASTPALSGSLNIKDSSSLEEMNVVVDMDKGLKLLKASFVSTTVLTDVFLTSASNGAKNNGLEEEVKVEVEEGRILQISGEKVKVEVEEGRILQISGERSKEQKEKNDEWHRVERSSGKFLRRFWLPGNANVDRVKASMDNGMLTVTVPKEEVKKAEVKSIGISG